RSKARTSRSRRTLSSSSSRPPAAWRTSRPPVTARFTPTAAAASGSSQAIPVRRTSISPTKTPRLVQKSDSTCLPSPTTPSPPARPHEVPAERGIHASGRDRERDAEVHVVHDVARAQGLERLPEDQHGGEGDQAALEDRAEVFDLAVPVGMAAVGWPPGEDEP